MGALLVADHLGRSVASDGPLVLARWVRTAGALVLPFDRADGSFAVLPPAGIGENLSPHAVHRDWAVTDRTVAVTDGLLGARGADTAVPLLLVSLTFVRPAAHAERGAVEAQRAPREVVAPFERL